MILKKDKMKRYYLALFTSILFGVCGTLNAAVVDTFDTDLEGWFGNPIGEVSWGSDDGNPGGYALFTDGSGNSSVLWAPNRYLGDWSFLGNTGYISFDHRIFNAGNNVVEYAPYRIYISGPEGAAEWFGEIPTGATDWTSIRAELIETEWTLNPGTQWQALIGNVTGFGIGIEMVNNRTGLGEIGGIDNISTNVVPIPAAVWLLGSGLIGLVGIRRKMKK